ncbi:hypothetical protein ACQP1O_13730 [Nocardia sp. CA-151230]
MTYDELDLPMPSTMQDEPLSLATLLRSASTVHHRRRWHRAAP